MDRRIATVLSELGSVDTWLAEQDLAEDRRALLLALRAERAMALAEMLVSWWRRGGSIRLSDPPEPEDIEGPPVDVVPAALEAAPAPVVALLEAPPARTLLAASAATADDWRPALRALLATIRSDRAAADEFADLDALVRDEARLRGFPTGVRLLLLEYCVARIRYLQNRGMEDVRIQTFMSFVAAYARRTSVGFVHGPKQMSSPKSTSWENDARDRLNDLYGRALSESDGTANSGRVIGVIADAIRDAAPFEEVRPLLSAAIRLGIPAANTRLVNLTAPFLGLMDRFQDLRPLRSAIRTAERDARAAPEPEDPAIPSDWPWLAFTRGKRVVMIGGEPREPNRLRIQEAFGFGELAWEATERSPRSIGAVRARITSGGADFLIILRRFVGHDTDDQLIPACGSTGIPWISVPSGYGISRIRQEIERRVPRPEPT